MKLHYLEPVPRLFPVCAAVLAAAFVSCSGSDPTTVPPPPGAPGDIWTLDGREYWKPDFDVYSHGGFWFIRARTQEAMLVFQFKELPGTQPLYQIVGRDPETPRQVRIAAFTGKSPHAVPDSNLRPRYYAGYRSAGGDNAWLAVSTVQGRNHFSCKGLQVVNLKDSTVRDVLCIRDIVQVPK